MQVAITARHGYLSDQAQAELREKAEKLLKYFERITQIAVTADFDSELPAVEIHVDAEHKHDFVAREQAATLAAAMDGAVKKMEQQIRRYKEKIQDHRRRPSAGSTPPAPPEAPPE